MRNKQSGRVFNYNKVDANWWGTIAPPKPGRFSEKIQDQGSVYLDIGTSGSAARNVFSATFHATDGGGFATRASGVTPIHDWELTTKLYTDLASKVDKDEGIYINSGVLSSGSIIKAKLGELRRKDIRANEVFTVSAGYDYNTNREIRLAQGAELVIEEGAELFVDTGGVFEGQYNVKNFGEFDEGSDITAALQAAIDAAGLAGGGEVTIPKGSFILSENGSNGYAILLDKNNVHVRGAGIGVTTLTGIDEPHTNDELIYLSGVDYCSISNMTLYGNNQWRNGIIGWGPNYCHVHDMKIHEFDLHACSFREGAKRSADHNLMENIHAYNDGQSGGLIVYSTSTLQPGNHNKHNRVLNCRSEGTSTWYGLELRHSDYTQVDNFTSIGNQYGLNIEEGASYNLYTNCVISGNAKVGLSYHGNIASQRCVDNTFVNCKFTGNSISTVRDLGSDNSTYIGCDFTNNASGYLVVRMGSVGQAGDGIDSRNITWDSCTFADNTDKVISARGTGHTMRGCRVTNNVEPDTAYRRILDFSQASGCTFQNLFCSGNNDDDATNSADIWIGADGFHQNQKKHSIDDSSIAMSQVYPGWVTQPGRYVPAVRMPPCPHPNSAVMLIQHSGCLGTGQWGKVASTQYHNYFEIPLGHLSGVQDVTGIKVRSRWLALSGTSPVIRVDNSVVGTNYDIPYDSNWHWIEYTIPIYEVSGIEDGGRFFRSRINSDNSEILCDGYQIELVMSGLTSATGATGSSTLDGLTDTSLGTLASGQMLSWNGLKWVQAHNHETSGTAVLLAGSEGNDTRVVTGEQAFNIGGKHKGLILTGSNTTGEMKASGVGAQLRFFINNLEQINVTANTITFNDKVLIAQSGNQGRHLSMLNTDGLADNIYGIRFQREDAADLGQHIKLMSLVGATKTDSTFMSYDILNKFVGIQNINPAYSLDATGDINARTNLRQGNALLDTLFATSGYLVPSGDYSTVSQGYEIYGLSGYNVPSGNYSTVEQGHQLWQSSGFLTVNRSGLGGFTAVNQIQFLNSTVQDLGGGKVQISGGTGGSGGGVTSLSELSDVTVTGPHVVGDILRSNGSTYVDVPSDEYFAPSGYQVPSGDYSTVDQGHQLWQASGFLTVGISGGGQQVNNVTSIQFVGGIATNIGTTAFVSGAAGGGGGVTNYDALTDTNMTTVESGHLAQYDGSLWQPFLLFSGILLTNGAAMPTATAAHQNRLFTVTETSGTTTLFAQQTIMTVLSGYNEGYKWIPMSQLVQ